MLTRLDRYLMLEVAKVFLAILCVLALILASLTFLRILEDVNVGALSAHLVLDFLRLQMIRDASTLLPPAFFLALLIALSRLARDSELVAMHACGIGSGRRYRTLLLLALPVALLTAWLSLSLKPWAAAGIQELRLRQSEQGARLAGLQAGRFYVEKGGAVVVYIGGIDREQGLSQVFLLDRRGETARLVASAGGRHRIEDGTGDHLVTLHSGHRFDGNPGAGEFLIGDFAEYHIRIRNEGAGRRASTRRATLPTATLMASSAPADRAELEHRLAAPLAVPILTLLAIPLVALSPRQKTTGRIVLAFLAYFSFFNLQRLAEHWLATGMTPLWLTSFWYQFAILAAVHLLLLSEHPGPRYALQRLRTWRGGPR